MKKRSGYEWCVWGVLLTNLSKAFDCLPYPHHTVKFHSYGLGKASTEYLKDCLTLQKQNIKISKTFSNWINTVPGEPQGSTFGPLLFNVFFCGRFLFIPNSDLVSYGDDNTPFAMSSLAMELITLREIIFAGFCQIREN